MKHIILIEDDAAIRDSLSMFLRGDDIAVTAYANGEVINADNYPLPDLYLIGDYLQGKDGLEVCRRLKAHYRTQNIPIIIFGGRPGVVRSASRAGATDVILKPCKLTVLRRVIRKHLDWNS